MQFMPKTISPREIQRSYKKIFEEVKETQEPVVVIKNNKPEVAIVSIEKLRKLLKEQDKIKVDASFLLKDAEGMWANRKDWQGKKSSEIVKGMRRKRQERIYQQTE